jgi:hypothetical protein
MVISMNMDKKDAATVVLGVVGIQVPIYLYFYHMTGNHADAAKAYGITTGGRFGLTWLFRESSSAYGLIFPEIIGMYCVAAVREGIEKIIPSKEDGSGQSLEDRT